MNDPSSRDIPEGAVKFIDGFEGSSIGRLKPLGKFEEMLEGDMRTYFSDGVAWIDEFSEEAGFHFYGSDYSNLIHHGAALEQQDCFIWLVATETGNIFAAKTLTDNPYTAIGSGGSQASQTYWLEIFSFTDEFTEEENITDANGNLIYPEWKFINLTNQIKAYDTKKAYDSVTIAPLSLNMKTRFPDIDSAFNVDIGGDTWQVYRQNAFWNDTTRTNLTGSDVIYDKFTPAVRDYWHVGNSSTDGIDYDGDGGSQDNSDHGAMDSIMHGANVIKLTSLEKDKNALGYNGGSGSDGTSSVHSNCIPKAAKETTVGVQWSSSSGTGTWPAHKTADGLAIQFYFAYVYADGSETREIIAEDRLHPTTQNTAITLSGTNIGTKDGWMASDNTDNQTGNRSLLLKIAVGLGGHIDPTHLSGYSSYSQTAGDFNQINAYSDHNDEGLVASNGTDISLTGDDIAKYGTADHMSRVVGFRMYWNHTTEYRDDRYLLCEVNYEKGYRIPPQMGWTPWTGRGWIKQMHPDPTGYDFAGLGNDGDYSSGWISTSSSTTTNSTWPVIYAAGAKGHELSDNVYWPGKVVIELNDPPLFDTFEVLNQFSRESLLSNVRYSTAVMVHGQLVVGNVIQDGIAFPDKMMVSPPGQFDVFPADNEAIVTANDGDKIIHLEYFADRVLQFKERKLYILNVSNGVEAIGVEAMYDYRGVKSANNVCNTENGVAWFNETGVFLYDGKGVKNLFEREGVRLIDITYFEELIKETDDDSIRNRRIGYDPIDKKIIIIGHSLQIFVYDVLTESWYFASQGTFAHKNATKITNLINFPDLRLGYLASSINTTQSDVSTIWHWRRHDQFFDPYHEHNMEGADGTPAWTPFWQSKEFVFDNASQIKRLKHFYMSFNVGEDDGSEGLYQYDVAIYLQYTDRDGIIRPVSFHGDHQTTYEQDPTDWHGFVGICRHASGLSDVEGGMMEKFALGMDVKAASIILCRKNWMWGGGSDNDYWGVPVDGFPAAYYINDMEISYRPKAIK